MFSIIIYSVGLIRVCMVRVYVPRSKFKIIRKKPRYARKASQSKHTISYTASTNNPKNLRLIKARKGNQVVYDK